MSPLIALAFAVAVTLPEPEPEPEPGPLYVHCLACPAVDVTGLDPAYLTESVPIALWRVHHA